MGFFDLLLVITTNKVNASRTPPKTSDNTDNTTIELKKGNTNNKIEATKDAATDKTKFFIQI